MRFGLLTSQSGPRSSLVVLFIGLSIPSVLVVALYLAGFDVVAALRDRSLSDVPEAGLVSNLGILLMGIAGATAAYEAWRTASLPLGTLALFCCLFTIDDAFLIHEAMGKWQIVVFAFYGLLAVLLLLLFSNSGQRLTWPIFMASSAFAVSIVMDVIWARIVYHLLLPAETAIFFCAG